MEFLEFKVSIMIMLNYDHKICTQWRHLQIYPSVTREDGDHKNCRRIPSMDKCVGDCTFEEEQKKRKRTKNSCKEEMYCNLWFIIEWKLYFKPTHLEHINFHLKFHSIFYFTPLLHCHLLLHENRSISNWSC